MDVSEADEGRDECGEPLPARFQRFEKVVVTDTKGRRHTGTILWRDLCHYSQYLSLGSPGPPRRWSRWEYAVDLPDLACCPTLEEDRLEATGEFDPEDAHRGRRYEISFDTGLETDNDIVEGSFRVPGEFWQIFIFYKQNDRGEYVAELRHESGPWASGITGIEFHAPKEAVINKGYVFRAFASVFGTDEWVAVRGPDSLLLK